MMLYRATALRTGAALFTIGAIPMGTYYGMPEGPPPQLADAMSLRAGDWSVRDLAVGWTSATMIPQLDERHNEVLSAALVASQELVSGPIFID